MLRKQVEDLKKQLEDAKKQLEEEKKARAEAEQKVGPLEKEVEMLRKQLEELKKELKDAQKALEEAAAAAAEGLSRERELAKDNAELAAKLKDLEKELEDLKALASHPLHQLYELKPFLGMDVKGESSEVGAFRPTDSADGEAISTDDPTQQMLGLYDKIGHTKRRGISYASNNVTAVTAGLAAEQQGVQPQWKICEVWCIASACMLDVCCIKVEDAWCVGCGMRHGAMAGEWHSDAEQAGRGADHPPSLRRNQEERRADRHRLRAAEWQAQDADIRELCDSFRPEDGTQAVLA